MPRFLQNSTPAVDPETGPTGPEGEAVRTLARHAAAPGSPVPPPLRHPVEQRLGADLGAARLHAGPEVTAGLAGLAAPAAALGRHVFLSDTAPQALLPRILGHELTHVAQARQAEPNLRQPLRLGGRGSPVERQAAATAGGAPVGAPLGTDANTVHRYDWAGAEAPGMAEWVEARYEAEAEREAARERWRAAVAARAPTELAASPASLAEAIAQSESSLLFQRSAMFDALQRQQTVRSFALGWLGYRPIVPADLLERWVEAEQAMITLGASAGEGPAAIEIRHLARRRLLTFVEALVPVLEAHEQEQRAREERERAEAERENELREVTMRGLRGDPLGGRAAAAGFALSHPRRDYFRAPPPRSPGLRRALARLQGEAIVLDAAAAAGDFAAATAAFDRMLMDRLGPAHEAAQAFAYQTGLLERQRELAARRPHAWAIPAVFYPELEYVDVAGPGGSRERVARGIPWQLYLYHTGFRGHESLATAGGEWVLEDLMAASAEKRPTNRAPSSAFEAAMLQQGATVDPPWELFEQLDSSLRFPKGRLVVQLPSGRQRTLPTTEPITLSSFLTGLGIALAVLGFILLTGGAGTPAAVAFVGAAAAGVGSTLAELHEKAEQGLLTQRDINQAILFIAADVASALTAGLGRIAAVSARAARLGNTASLLGRYVVPLQRAARASQVTGAALDVASAAVVTAELVRQAQLIESSRLSEEEKEAALGRLVLTGLLTASLTTVSVAGDIGDIGRRGGLQLDVDDAGRPLLRAATEAGTEAAEEAGETATQREIRRRQQEIDAWLMHRTASGAAVPAPPTPRRVEAAVRRFERGRPREGDLAHVVADAVADMRAYVTLSRGDLSPAACAGYCNLAAKGQVPASVLGLLENSRVPVQVDAMSASVLGEGASRPAGAPGGAAHQFAIVRAGREAYIVDPTFAQFLTPGSRDVRQGQEVLAPGFLDTPEGARLVHELVGQGYVPLTPENAALYARALALDLGPVGDTTPGPVASLLLSGEQHYSTLRFVSEAGSIRFVEAPPGAPGFPATAGERETRAIMIGNVERPDDLIELIERQLRESPTPTTPEARAAQDRLRARLRMLEDLATRYRQRVGPWATD